MHVIADNWPYLLRAAVNTLWMAAVSIAVSTVAGMLFGIGCAVGVRVVRVVNAVAVWIVRGVPLLVVLFVVYYSLPADLSPYVAAIVALSFYFTFFVSEVVRGAIQAIPRGQVEAAKSVGLSFWQRMRLVILPQAVRAAVPPLMNLWVILVKGTAYASVISAWELTTASTEVAQRTVAPFPVYGFAMLVYFFICFALTRIGRAAEARLRYQH
ncbi:MAG TPA: amino acid ABC transporter permease [Candidatus Dormibacteraeota bacterium]|nr:amino acid ABC transporter permease [Candidatus Dormibacteraeota bacterium]